MVPDLVQGAALAAKSNWRTMLLRKNTLDVLQGVLLRARGRDAGIGKPLVSGEGLEEGDGLLEEVDGFLAGLVAAVAGGRESADASSVLAPFVLPESFVVSLVVLPVGVHVVEGVISTKGL